MAWVLEYQPTILLPGKGQIPLEPWDFQQEFMNCMDRFKIINKPRQCGISTIVAAIVAWEFDNVPGAQIVIISKDKDAAINFHTYVYNILRSVRRNNLKAPKLLKENERVTTNELGSKITSLASSKEAGRSFSASHLIFDELAFIEYADDIWQAANATLAQTGGKVTAISTPKGRANLFARIFETSGNMGFTTFSYAWWHVPTYNPYYHEFQAAKTPQEREKYIALARTGDWYKNNRPKYTDLAWRQEFEGAFDANVGSVFSTRQLEKVFVRNYLVEKDGQSQGLAQWWTSQKTSTGIYIHAIDLGRKNDPTEILIYDVSQKPVRLAEFKHIEAGTLGWDEIGDVIKSTIDFWQSQGEHDATGAGDALDDVLTGYSEPFFFTKTTKEAMITLMQHAFDHGIVQLPKIPIIYQQHQRYQFDDKLLAQDTVMANGIGIRQFHDTEDFMVGFQELNFVGA